MALALFGLKKPICILIKIYIYDKISKTILMIFQNMLTSLKAGGAK